MPLWHVKVIAQSPAGPSFSLYEFDVRAPRMPAALLEVRQKEELKFYEIEFVSCVRTEPKEIGQWTLAKTDRLIDNEDEKWT